MFEQIYEKIKEYNNIIIHRHRRPDGDCIGSQHGLKYMIKETFPEKNVYAVGGEGPDYLLPLIENDLVEDSLYQSSLVIVVDTAVVDRIYDDRWKNGKEIIKIDHHDDSPEYGNINYIDSTAPACASIIVRMYNELNGLFKLSKKAAYYLYYGMVTDTGRFRYRGVDAEVFKNASILLDQGIDIQELYDSLYIDKPETLKLQGYVYTNYKLTPHGVAYIYFTKKMMHKYKVSREDASNLVNSLSSIEGSLIWVAFIDQMQPSDKSKKPNPKDEIRARLRSRHVSINDIAAKYRGGGHLQAAGATIYSKKEMKDILDELDYKLAQYKKENPNAR